MAFRFRLEKVLKVRQRLVDMQARELAEANRRVVEASRRIEELTGEIRRYESLDSGSGRPLAAIERMNLSRWIGHLCDQRGELENARVELMIHLEAERQKMTRAWQDLEVLKKLKDRQEELWREEIQKRDRREMDEIGLQRAERTRREEIASV